MKGLLFALVFVGRKVRKEVFDQRLWVVEEPSLFLALYRVARLKSLLVPQSRAWLNLIYFYRLANSCGLNILKALVTMRGISQPFLTDPRQLIASASLLLCIFVEESLVWQVVGGEAAAGLLGVLDEGVLEQLDELAKVYFYRLVVLIKAVLNYWDYLLVRTSDADRHKDLLDLGSSDEACITMDYLNFSSRGRGSTLASCWSASGRNTPCHVCRASASTAGVGLSLEQVLTGKSWRMGCHQISDLIVVWRGSFMRLGLSLALCSLDARQQPRCIEATRRIRRNFIFENCLLVSLKRINVLTFVCFLFSLFNQLWSHTSATTIRQDHRGSHSLGTRRTLCFSRERLRLCRPISRSNNLFELRPRHGELHIGWNLCCSDSRLVVLLHLFVFPFGH